MEVCVVVEIQEGVSWNQWLGMAQACEESGLHGLFSSDHYLSVVGYTDRGGFDAWATLAALAVRTQRIRLGTLVSPVTFRHPSELAKVAVTVDHLSGGRVELGLGAAWNEQEHRAYGFPFPDLDTRLCLLAEQLEIIVRAWSGENLAFAGDHYQLEASPRLPKPLQRPRPPIIVGGSAKPRSLDLAVRFADEYNSFLIPLEECSRRRRLLDSACKRARRDPATIGFSLMTSCLIGADQAEVDARLRALVHARGKGEPDRTGLPASGLEFWLVGTVDETVDQLQALAAAGVRRVYLHHPLPSDTDMIELLGQEVVPAVSEA